MKNFLWLGGIFDEVTLKKFPSISAAANFWQRGFVEALKHNGNCVEVIGYPAERAWPFGRLAISSTQAHLPSNLEGKTIGYINAPFLRDIVQYLNYLRTACMHLSVTGRAPDYVVTYSCIDHANKWTSSSEAAKSLRKRFGSPWVCIVGDGIAPRGADHYVYSTWKYFDTTTSPSPKLFLDGGVPSVEAKMAISSLQPIKKNVLMFMGALSAHAGVSWLARAFNLIQDENIELWISGRGENAELQQLAQIDNRIKLMGFVSEKELNELAAQVSIFVNPRPSNFEPNKLNYPSKLLHYLAFEKPIISTLTPGVSPEYEHVLIPVKDETDACLADTITRALNMSENEIAAIAARIRSFNATHSWSFQVSRFTTWLETC
jgi:glycosyltransferase involved in cell wall biosynthesis